MEFERTIFLTAFFTCWNKTRSRESILRGRIYRDCNPSEIREISFAGDHAFCPPFPPPRSDAHLSDERTEIISRRAR